MGASRGSLAIAAVAAVAAACSLADLSGLSDDALPNAPAVEAGPPAVIDGAVPDGAVAVDAGTSDAAPKGFCEAAGPHTLCDDFDTTADPGWTSFEKFGGGSGARDLGVFASPPASYAVQTPMVSPDGGEAWMFPVRVIPITTKHVHLEAKVQACATVGDYIFLGINNTATTYGTIDFGTRPTASGAETFMVIRHDGLTKDFKLGPALPSTRFVSVVIDTDIDTTVGSVKLSIDGVVVVNATNLPTDQTTPVTKRTVFAGVYSYKSPACSARIDDVIIDVN